MRVRWLVLSLLALSILVPILWTAWRGALAHFLLHDHYALLERWGGEDYFVPAFRRYRRQPPAGVEAREQFLGWVKRRVRGRFPDESILDVQLLPSGEIAFLLLRTGAPESQRVVLLDPARSDLQTAASERVDHDARSMDWWGDWVLLDGGGSMVISLAFHREGSVVRLIPSRMEVSNGPPFLWGWPRFEDIDDDGVPEVMTYGSGREPCPGCDEFLERREETWKVIDGSYQEWAVRDYWCAGGCKPDKSN